MLIARQMYCHRADCLARLLLILIIFFNWTSPLCAQHVQTIQDKFWRYEGEIREGKLNGKGKAYFEGAIMKEGFFRNGKLEGEGIEYDPTGSGRIWRRGVFKNGEFVEGKVYLDGKELSYEGSFKAGNLHGKGTYYSRGKKRMEGIFLEGKLVRGTIYDYDGSRSLVGEFVSDKLNGNGLVYYSGGTVILKAGEFRNGELYGQGAEYWTNGKLQASGNYKNDELNGYGYTYDQQGHLESEGKFVDGELSIGRTFTSEGKVSELGTFVKGKLSGLGIIYYSNGRVFREGYFDKGILNGVGRIYWDNGKVREEGTFRQGYLHGAGRSWNYDGSLSEVGTFVNGAMEGQGIVFGTGRRYRLEGKFHKSMPIGEVAIFDPNGHCVYTGSAEQGVPLFAAYVLGQGVSSTPLRSSQVSSNMGSLLGAVAMFAGAAYLADKLFPDPPKLSSKSSSKFSSSFWSFLQSSGGGAYPSSSSSSSPSISRSQSQSTSADPNDILIPQVKEATWLGEGKQYSDGLFGLDRCIVDFEDSKRVEIYRSTGWGYCTHSGYGVYVGSLAAFVGPYNSDLWWYETQSEAIAAAYVYKYHGKDQRTIGLMKD